jgi:hypothetical protein
LAPPVRVHIMTTTRGGIFQRVNGEKPIAAMAKSIPDLTALVANGRVKRCRQQSDNRCIYAGKRAVTGRKAA